MGFLTIIHIIIAVLLIVLVLVQDSKGAMGGTFGGSGGGGGSQSLLGAQGATNLLQKITKWMVIGFAITSILITKFSSDSNKSALDDAPAAAATQPNNATQTESAAPATATEPPKTESK